MECSVAPGSAVTAEISGKYQKLASEYAKMRAQVSVLKKAVLDEQSKGAELKEILKARDHAIRTNEQEMESLTFRNQQLTCRVSILQEELDSCQQKGRNKSKNKSSAIDSPSSQPQLANHILGEELQQKIEENARLHQRVFEADQEHRRVIGSLESRVRELERDALGHQNDIEKISANNGTLIERLQQENAKLEVRVQAAEKDLKDSRVNAEVCEDQLRRARQELKSSLQVISARLPFVDLKYSQLNRLNVPSCSRRARARSLQLVEQVGEIVRSIVSGLLSFHSYSEQLALVCCADDAGESCVGEANKKLALHLHDHASYLRKLEQSYYDFESEFKADSSISLEISSCFKEFTQKLSDYVLYLKVLIPYHHLSLDEECSASSISPNLRTKNQCLKDVWLRFQAAFEKLNAQTKCLMMERAAAARRSVLIQLAQAVRDLHEVFKEMCLHYNGKLMLEFELPTACDKSKAASECLVTSLASLVTSTGKLSLILGTRLEEIVSNRATVSWVSPVDGDSVDADVVRAVASLKRRAVAYMATLEEECPEFVSYAEAIQNRHILKNSTESQESLAFQLNSCQEKISKLEQSREHWMLEYRLLHMKYEKLMKRAGSLEGQGSLSGSDGSPTHDVGGGVTTSAAADSVVVLSSCQTSLLGKLVAGVSPSSEESTTEGGDGSDELRGYLVGRVNELIVHRQLAESRAAAFHSEVCAVHRRLALAEKLKTSVHDELAAAGKEIGSLKEELLTTTNSYKTQLSMMSEHLASMNEKLAAQKDEIDALKYSMSNVGNKKNKGNIK